jgi:hypothetical protein
VEEFLVCRIRHSCNDNQYNGDGDGTVDDIQKKTLLQQKKEVVEDGRRHDNIPVGKIDFEKNYEESLLK